MWIFRSRKLNLRGQKFWVIIPILKVGFPQFLDWSIFVIDFKDKVKIAAIAEELYTTQLIDKAELLQ